MTNVTLYTDGAFSRRTQTGGYAFKLTFKSLNGEEYSKEHSDKVLGTTSNRMELLAIIEGLNALKTSCRVLVISDSTYCVDTVNKWLGSFIKDPMRANHDLMCDLYKAIKRHEHVEAMWIRGHGDIGSHHDRVDELAQKAAGTWREKKKCQPKQGD